MMITLLPGLQYFWQEAEENPTHDWAKRAKRAKRVCTQKRNAGTQQYGIFRANGHRY